MSIEFEKPGLRWRRNFQHVPDSIVNIQLQHEGSGLLNRSGIGMRDSLKFSNVESREHFKPHEANVITTVAQYFSTQAQPSALPVIIVVLMVDLVFIRLVWNTFWLAEPWGPWCAATLLAVTV